MGEILASGVDLSPERRKLPRFLKDTSPLNLQISISTIDLSIDKLCSSQTDCLESMYHMCWLHVPPWAANMQQLVLVDTIDMDMEPGGLHIHVSQARVVRSHLDH